MKEVNQFHQVPDRFSQKPMLVAVKQEDWLINLILMVLLWRMLLAFWELFMVVLKWALVNNFGLLWRILQLGCLVNGVWGEILIMLCADCCLRRLREEELVQLRGNGEAEHKSSDRIYDYDVYNDLGDLDTNIDLKRLVLGGTIHHPYPRRCRTGRKYSDADPSSEKKGSSFYVPRDDAFAEIKQTQSTTTTVSSGLSAILESLDAILTGQNLGFVSFEDIDTLYKEGFHLPPLKDNGLTLLQRVIPKFIEAVNDSQNILRFDTPVAVKRDKFFWFSDEEFARETLSSLNPYSIQLVKEWPLRSTLEPQIMVHQNQLSREKSSDNWLWHS